MSYQDIIFREYLDPQKLKAGKVKCPCCNRQMKAYGYNLDDKLVALAYEILAHCTRSGQSLFHPRQVFSDNYHRLTQFQKLKYFGIIERTKKASVWRLKRTGYQFLKRKRLLPSKVWVFNDEVVLSEDGYVDVSQVDPRWKETSGDWTSDYILQRYETQPTLL
jgi:hypothetical protein